MRGIGDGAVAVVTIFIKVAPATPSLWNDASTRRLRGLDHFVAEKE